MGIKNNVEEIAKAHVKAGSNKEGLAYLQITTSGVITVLKGAPPAQPVAVPDECSIFEAAIDECRKSDSIDEHAWNHGVLVVMSKFEACRAAMLNIG